MKALITGAAGFIGSTLAERLIRDGVEVVGIDSLTDYYDPRLKRRNIAGLHGRAEIIEADLNEVDLAALLSDTDVVFHLAGQPGVRKSWGRDFDTYVAENIQATQRLLEAAHLAPSRPRIVFASSSSVYGDAESFPTDETATPRPRSPYGVTKLAAEHLCRLYSANHGLETVSLRFFTVYGPRQRPDMAFTRFLRAADQGEPLTIYGSGEQVRDFTFVGDIVDAVARAATADVPPGTVLNISGGGSHSVNDVLNVIADLVGGPLDVIRTAVALGDVSRTGADISAARELLAWAPATGLEQGLRAQLEWVRDEARSSTQAVSTDASV
ncbi:MAG: UDP-glucose 4-epimerase [Microbacterium sp. SCN 70-27]|mgnify:CR=1 FL=1|uniref:NAD-dependent epimerase/dehydratase family protein n=1 Tax=unclassified Microbacterium TaxID=2609290 RepID=UPI00086D4FDA|nr:MULTISPECIES: NAD-dependent epimerase/dehydratase family protein [unclassified Microbacterium]MBN9225379.1 NAD-dependent epimerase/dehydratase family protein [Microbacterium sp.]ODT29018.1 MAG: UDP-glucose 4-epimerase [Microbacterium sp. SCN 70-27]